MNAKELLRRINIKFAPPAYTEYLGKQLIQFVKRQAVAS